MAMQRAEVFDRHLLYTAAVQSVDVDLDFFSRVYRKQHGRPFRLLREDFCGTAVLSTRWVERHAEHRAWGVDLDRPTLAWARRHCLPRLGDAADRMTLIQGNVLEAHRPKVDVVAALNFSYCVFKDRDTLRSYFRQARRTLRKGGLFFLDLFGGTESVVSQTERRRIPASTAADGRRVPAFTYVWDQARFNPVTHEILCHIHFHLRGGRKLRRAFSYDWRLWTLPELREILAEAGFHGSEVYVEGWDEKNEDGDGIYRKKTYFENDPGWLAYVVGFG